MLNQLARGLVEHRGRWTLVALGILALSVWLGSRLTMRQEVSDFLPVGSAAPDTLPLAGRDADRIIVVLEGPSAISVEHAAPLLDEMAHRLAVLPGIARVDARLDQGAQHFLSSGLQRRLLLYFTPAQLDSIRLHLAPDYQARALLGRGAPIARSTLARALGIERTDPLGVIGPALALVRVLAGEMPGKIINGYFATPDQRSYFISVLPAARLSTIGSARTVVKAIDGVLQTMNADRGTAPLRGAARWYATGRPVALVSGIAIATRDVQRVGIATTIVVLLMLIVALRRIAAPLLMIGTVLYGLALTSAVAFLIYGSISPVSWLFIATLVGFGDEFALYVVAHYWLVRRTTNRAEALAAAIRAPGPGILLGGLTSAAAFFSLIAISYPIMHQLAWLTTVGLLLILACAFTVLPLALAYSQPGRDSDSGWQRWGHTAFRIGQSHRGAWLAGWIALLLSSAWLARDLRFDLHPWKLAVHGVPATAQLDELSQRLGASFTPFTMVSRGATLEEALTVERAAVKRLDEIRNGAGIAGVVALSRWIPAPAVQDSDIAYLKAHAAGFDSARFIRGFATTVAQMPAPDSLLIRRYAPLVAGYLHLPVRDITIATLDSDGMGPFVRDHMAHLPTQYLLRADVYLTQVPWAAGAVEQFTEAIARDTSGAFRSVQFRGDALRGATHVSVLRRNMIAVVLLALSLTILVLALRFHDPALVLLCLLPLACGVAAALAALALLHIELNMLTLAIVPLLIGLGSDDGIHIVDRLERQQAVPHVLADVAAPMIITTATTIAGFACLAFASFPGVRETGLIAAGGLVVCLIGSMQLVPMGYAFLRRGSPAPGRN